ncbi:MULTISPECIES: hypothetical protein [Alphaproteobacteria]|uniref:Uncharacterized protein n=2 Tax=Alphaproteobacteria TaxID=28211 RepID=A0A512HMU1_9HYPH|nr:MULTISPECIES: hypothetical protein [Alphaproteobacteria]GEO86768.1 hypothetical protein RNA01_37000 [Ciceribacter naphthalenivorans]GLR23347.1 hypothetical protein GCM10007920_31380 [Ciceribacter naphthalenivorans]GLT06203.1 hypothetical protein GCM10007926_31380 [Sphingomonas psychrolutea]
MNHDRRIETEKISRALAAILSSQTFARSERLRTFLKFVVEHEQLGLAHQIKGYTIGMDVFSRDGVLDPGVEALVRVQAGKLRRLLNLYYADEGRNDPVRIRIPLGGYVPVYEVRADVRRTLESAVAGLPAAEGDLDGAIRIDRPTGAGSDHQPGRGQPAQTPDDQLPDLPQIHIVISSTSDWRARTFENALRFLETRLCALSLAPLRSPFPAEPRCLDFLLKLDSAHGTGPLRARLVHPATGATISAQSRPAAGSASSRQVAAFANLFGAQTMTLSGEIYAFCSENGISTPLMDSLEATYHYRLENSHDAYLEASRHQQRLVHPQRLPAFITELSDLLALTIRQS